MDPTALGLQEGVKRIKSQLNDINQIIQRKKIIRQRRKTMIVNNHSEITLKNHLQGWYYCSNFLIRKFNQSMPHMQRGFHVFKIFDLLVENQTKIQSSLTIKNESISTKLLNKAIVNLDAFGSRARVESKPIRKWELFRRPTQKFPKSSCLYHSKSQKDQTITTIFNSKLESSKPMLPFILPRAKDNMPNYTVLNQAQEFSDYTQQQLYQKKKQQNQLGTYLNQAKQYSKQEILQMLRKEKDVVEIWVPPVICPQLVGVLSIRLVKSKFKQKQSLRIQKHIFNRYILSSTLFAIILDWACIHYGNIKTLQMKLTRFQLDNMFVYYGWKPILWIKDDIYICQFQKI